MDIQNLVPVDYSNQRVLTTAQVAEVFGTTPNVIKENFRYAKKQFEEGVHYFKVTGEALRTLKFQLTEAQASGKQNTFSAPASPIPKMASAVILYTEQGTARHCQMLNNPNALAIMEQLRAGYFNQKPVMTPLVPQVFNHPQFGNLRIVIIDGVIWFVGKDVAESLGYKDTFAALNQHVDDEDKLVWQITSAGQRREVTVINESGLYSLILRSNLPEAKKYRHWIMEEVAKTCEKTLLPLATPQVFDKVGYIDDKGTAWFNAEFVARELGFVDVHFAKSGERWESVRWARVEGYLKEFGFSADVRKGFLPENIVYRLAMKANNDTAVKFQMKIANEILPSIRKYGFYSKKPVETSLFPDEPVKKVRRAPVPELAVVYAALLSNSLVKSATRAT